MPKAIFHRDAEIRSRSRNVAWSIRASSTPQSFPRECIDLAVEQGAAERVPPKRQTLTASGPDQQGE